MAKKTKRKIAYRQLPMQQQLNFRKEGKHFDLGELFHEVNTRFLRGRRRRRSLRRRGSRCYVLLDEVPEGCREQERDQLRSPVPQKEFLHNVRAIKSRRSAGEMFPA